MSYSLFLIGKKNCIKKKLLNQRNEVDKEIYTQKKKKKQLMYKNYELESRKHKYSTFTYVPLSACVSHFFRHQYIWDKPVMRP